MKEKAIQNLLIMECQKKVPGDFLFKVAKTIIWKRFYENTNSYIVKEKNDNKISQ